MFLLLTALLAAPLPAVAQPADSGRTINGVTLPGTVEVAGQTLNLNGGATRKKMIFKIYVAGLYVTQTSTKAEDILAADAPRQMALHFISDKASKEKMCSAWTDGLKDNTPDASAELTQQFADLCEMMADTKNGDVMTLTYVPGTGTTVVFSGTDKGTIAGKEFADAVLRCWIGPKPGPGEGFKKDLLGAK
jgi:hypothetical protein